MKQYKLKILFSFLSIIMYLSVISQNNSMNGLIVTINNDTLHGIINVKSDIKNCNSCEFQIRKGFEPTIYSPEELLAYEINNETYFVQKTIEIDSVIKTVFVEYLFDGIIDLYYYTDINGSFYLIEDENNNIEKLYTKTSFIKDDENYRYYYNNKRYIGILKTYFKDTPELFLKIERCKLNHLCLPKLFIEYHKLKGLKNDYQIYAKKLKFIDIDLIPIVGYSKNRMNVLEGHFDVPFEFETYPTYGISANIYFPQLSENFSLLLNGKLSTFSFNYSETLGFSQLDLYYDYEISAKPLTLVTALQYSFIKDRIEPYFALGINFSQLNDFKTYRSITSVLTSGYESKKEHSEIVFPDKLSGAYASFGIIIKSKKMRNIGKIFFEYENQRGNEDNPIFKMNIFNVGIGLFII